MKITLILSLMAASAFAQVKSIKTLNPFSKNSIQIMERSIENGENLEIRDLKIVKFPTQILEWTEITQDEEDIHEVKMRKVLKSENGLQLTVRLKNAFNSHDPDELTDDLYTDVKFNFPLSKVKNSTLLEINSKLSSWSAKNRRMRESRKELAENIFKIKTTRIVKTLKVIDAKKSDFCGEMDDCEGKLVYKMEKIPFLNIKVIKK